jgi:phosphate transport system permease protein
LADTRAPSSTAFAPESSEAPIQIPVIRSGGDRVFRVTAFAAGLLVFVIIVAIAVFLAVQAVPALRGHGFVNFLRTQEWNPDNSGRFGIPGLILGTVLISAIALALALPISLACALGINEYAPPRLRATLISLVDLLAALPSLVYGFWGLIYLQPRTVGVARWLHDHLGFIPLFKATPTQLNKGFASSMFVAGLVVTIMVVPIITSVSREVLSLVPRENCEAALALGGTRWGMIRDVILPFGRRGIIGASMLGLGRALGETIAVSLILAPDYKVCVHVLVPCGGSIAATIVAQFNNALTTGRSALVAAGLVLFVITLAVNLVAAVIVGRTRSEQGLAL